MIIFTDGRAPWTSGQSVARPLPNHRTTQTQNKRIHTPNIHALCWIRTHDPGFRTSEDSTCLRPLGYRDRPLKHLHSNKEIKVGEKYLKAPSQSAVTRSTGVAVTRCSEWVCAYTHRPNHIELSRIQAGLNMYVSASTHTTTSHQARGYRPRSTLTAVSLVYHLPVHTNDRIMQSYRPQATYNTFL
jgi:hypothetical protein